MADFSFNQNGEEAEGAEGHEGTTEVPLEEGFVEEKSTTGRNAGMLLAGFALLGAGVIYFMRVKTGPDAANANPTKQVVEANTTISDFLKDGNQNIKKMHDLLLDTKKFVTIFKTHESKPQVKADDLMTNPFQFAKPKADLTEEQKEALRLEEERKQHELEKRRFLETVSSVKLGFILTGKKKSCMINQKMYTEGQDIGDGVLVKTISPDGVTLARGEYEALVSVKK